MKQEDRELKKRFEEQANRAYQTNCYVYTAFLNELEQNVLMQCLEEFPVGVSLDGGHPLCERKIAVFGEEAVFGYGSILPVSLIYISPLSKKYAEQLNHRDVLGAVMNLGIERSMVGDIFINEKGIYLFCLEQMADYIMKQLTRIRHTVVQSELIPLESASELTLAQAQESTVLVSSLRLDAVVAAVYHLSRQESQQAIRDKKVSVAGRITENNSGLIKEASMISVRGKGRFYYQGIAYQTKKGKYQLKILIYQ